MLKVIIVEDTPHNISMLQDFLQNYQELIICGIAHTISEANLLITQNAPDIVFLDLALPDGNGSEILEKYQDTGIKFFVISAHLEKYLGALIDKYAFAVLTKPFDYQLIAKHLTDVIQQTQKVETSEKMEVFLENMKYVHNQNQRYVIKTKEGLEIILIQDILFCESGKNGTLLYLNNGTDKPECTKVPLITMDDLENTFQKYGFIRIHKSFLVNQAYIKKYITDGSKKIIVLQNGNQLSVPRERRKHFEKTFLEAFDLISNQG